jgi:hypothetical protein
VAPDAEVTGCLVAVSVSSPNQRDRLLTLQSERSSAAIERVLWVETTRPRAAAYGQRAFNAGFPAMNPICRPSEPDPFQTLNLTP